MKQQLRHQIAKIASYTEIFVAGITLIAIVLYSLMLLFELPELSMTLRGVSSQLPLDVFLNEILQVVIVIEFVKMLAKHTPESVIEVLLFAIARKLIVDHNIDALQLLIGVIAIAVLFAIRKFLNVTARESEEGMLLSGGSSLKSAFELCNGDLKIDESIHGDTLAGMIHNYAKEHNEKIAVGYTVKIGNVSFQVYSMDNGLIKLVQIIK